MDSKTTIPTTFPKRNLDKSKNTRFIGIWSDCDSGKMTTAWEIKKRLQAENKNVEFIGTANGILLSGGVAVDALLPILWQARSSI
ncbi:MAG: hypothetical protein Ct9H90mP20_6520 [Candidatus Neomarinimicrobiota bacterium]|nr:MAG: hypothetical protein Ct9H90mP20_6520 [Candidatus Neomarinimicrobiota bacterium]